VTPAKRPTNAQHLRVLITRWSKEPDAETYGRLQCLVGVTVGVAILDGLKDTDGNERIGYKGGWALELRFGFVARASMDLDAAFRGAIEEALDEISAALAVGWHGFTGRLGNPEEITRAGVEPPPVRVAIKLFYEGKAFVTVPFEISRAEGASLAVLDRLPSAVSLAPVQLPDLDTITFLPLRYQIAQKLHACTEAPTGERVNNRARDLHDLLLIEELGIEPEQLPAIRQACVEIFAGRAKHAWPPALSAPVGWDAIWHAICEAEGTSLTLADAIEQVTALIGAIDAAR
jgi:hypothetical protein